MDFQNKKFIHLVIWCIKLFLFYHWSKITHKTKNKGLFMASGVEKCFQNLKIILRLYFRNLRAQINPNFRFLSSFWSVIENKEYDISKCVINLFILKIQIFSPFLQYCQILTKSGNVPKRAVGEKRTSIRYQEKKLHFLHRN